MIWSRGSYRYYVYDTGGFDRPVADAPRDGMNRPPPPPRGERWSTTSSRRTRRTYCNQSTVLPAWTTRGAEGGSTHPHDDDDDDHHRPSPTGLDVQAVKRRQVEEHTAASLLNATCIVVSLVPTSTAAAVDGTRTIRKHSHLIHSLRYHSFLAGRTVSSILR